MIDVVLAAIPIYIVWRLQVSRAQKILIVAIFSTKLLSVRSLISIEPRLKGLQHHTSDNTSTQIHRIRVQVLRPDLRRLQNYHDDRNRDEL